VAQGNRVEAILHGGPNTDQAHAMRKESSPIASGCGREPRWSGGGRVGAAQASGGRLGDRLPRNIVGHMNWPHKTDRQRIDVVHADLQQLLQSLVASGTSLSIP